MKGEDVLGETKQKTRILLVDDHHMVRQGIRQLLEREPDFQVVAEAGNGLEALKLTRELKPDIVVMETCVSRVDGVEVARRVKTEHPKARVIILTTSADEESIVALVAAGASGYLLKCADGQELVQGIRSVLAGGFVFEPTLAQKIFKHTARLPIAVNSAEHLTPRELDVLKLTAKGLNNQEIANQLGIGKRTVRQHLMNIYGKMGVNSRTEAVSKALKQNWFELD